MAYSQQTWVDLVTDMDAAHFNHMEQGIADAHALAALPSGTGKPAGTPLIWNGTAWVAQTAASDYVRVDRSNSGSWAYTAAQSGDTYLRLQITADGRMQWGPGTADVDTNLYRQAANQLATDDSFYALGSYLVTTGDMYARWGLPGQIVLTNGPLNGGLILFGSAQDTNLYRSAANTLKTDDSFESAGIYSFGRIYSSTFIHANASTASEVLIGYRAAIGGADAAISFGSAYDVNLYRAGADILKTDDELQVGLTLRALGGSVFQAPANPWDQVIRTFVPGESDYRFIMTADGTMVWGTPGTYDTNLYRSAANTLKTDDAFIAALSIVVDAGGATGAEKLYFGSALDTNLYRSAANTLKTDDAFNAVGVLTARIGDAYEVGLGWGGLPGPGIYFGNAVDTNLYRSAAGVLGTDHSFRAGDDVMANVGKAGQVAVGHTGSGYAAYITFGQFYDTNLYRSAADTLKTDDNFIVGGNLTVVGTYPGGGGAASLVTALPGSPTNGQECVFTDSLTAPTYYWHLKYNSTTTKWHYVGGTPLFVEVATDEATTSTSYAALTTAGPSIALPLAGDYDVDPGFTFYCNDGGAGVSGFMSYDIGGTAAVDADATTAPSTVASSSPRLSVARSRRKTGLTAVTLTAKYKVQGGFNGHFLNRWLRVTPVKLG
jgi:hypothetical protein